MSTAVAATAPNPPQSRAINEIKRLLSRPEPDFATAKTWVARAIGGNVACLEPFRNAVARKGLPEKQKLDFLIEAVPEADAAIVRLYGKDCFTPASEVYGHFWRLAETRGFVRLLLDIVFCAADVGDWETAVQYSKRILQMNHGDNNGIRDRVPLFMLHLGRPLDALNFCLSWLDTTHDKYDNSRYCPLGGFADERRYTKEDLDPSKPLQLKVQNLGHASLIFTSALACYKIYGPCTLSTSWLREGFMANSHVVNLLLTDSSTWPSGPNQNPRGLGSEPEAMDYIFFSRQLWQDEDSLKWVRDCAAEVQKRECSARECRKVEAEKGEYKMCSGCRASWYCGTDCQAADWKSGHKRRCKEERNIRELTEQMGKGMQWGK
ncbi:hypothetical protein FPQ18DRAFT_392507 [Pyronema domesticum]|uniref:Similar to Zinc finger MYND domain-containing protein 19 acc. no. Q7TSV3 n=1 Tax=Pyronema omphalodes (strain CBS 100304) TaxID=1076935 RepID=U4L7E3_PYROM|nr:hypothetical protein FPQ18DRAFT_392507 [Pyronema domesticum]CCX13093.1 Similar to Zinc finger MYND domain-containing protein 19; acc. no. Q7TSV3 [Pyronema omphalodes CBS 100304]